MLLSLPFSLQRANAPSLTSSLLFVDPFLANIICLLFSSSSTTFLSRLSIDGFGDSPSADDPPCPFDRFDPTLGFEFDRSKTGGGGESDEFTQFGESLWRDVATGTNGNGADAQGCQGCLGVAKYERLVNFSSFLTLQSVPSLLVPSLFNCLKALSVEPTVRRTSSSLSPKVAKQLLTSKDSLSSQSRSTLVSNERESFWYNFHWFLSKLPQLIPFVSFEASLLSQSASSLMYSKQSGSPKDAFFAYFSFVA
mmetsp:Transcript_93981/g.148542  ORF Transcript_93981/g.148542 Transcript_93981/m.148542 type:complete len:252 (-) Transcript_93981:199-954(-)